MLYAVERGPLCWGAWVSLGTFGRGRQVGRGAPLGRELPVGVPRDVEELLELPGDVGEGGPPGVQLLQIKFEEHNVREGVRGLPDDRVLRNAAGEHGAQLVEVGLLLLLEDLLQGAGRVRVAEVDVGDEREEVRVAELVDQLEDRPGALDLHHTFQSHAGVEQLDRLEELQRPQDGPEDGAEDGGQSRVLEVSRARLEDQAVQVGVRRGLGDEEETRDEGRGLVHLLEELVDLGERLGVVGRVQLADETGQSGLSRPRDPDAPHLLQVYLAHRAVVFEEALLEARFEFFGGVRAH